MYNRFFILVRKVVTGADPLPPGIVVGNNVYISDCAKFDWSHGRHITIEDDVTLAPGVRILCHDASSKRSLGVTWVAPVTIKTGAFIGAEAVLMPGIVVGERAIVAAGSVVTDDVSPGAIVAGVPARTIGMGADLDAKRKRQMLETPIFRSAECEKDKLDRALEQQLRAAIAKHGGYFLA